MKRRTNEKIKRPSVTALVCEHGKRVKRRSEEKLTKPIQVSSEVSKPWICRQFGGGTTVICIFSNQHFLAPPISFPACS